MRDYQFIVDEKGEKTAVVIDLKKCAALWEDLYDTLIVQQRAKGPRESLDAVRKRLQRAGKLDA